MSLGHSFALAYFALLNRMRRFRHSRQLYQRFARLRLPKHSVAQQFRAYIARALSANRRRRGTASTASSDRRLNESRAFGMLFKYIEQERDDVFGFAYRLFPRIWALFENEVGRVRTSRQSHNLHVEPSLERRTGGSAGCFQPASSASRAMTRLSVMRRISCACSGVNAVPETATVFAQPAWCDIRRSICPSTKIAQLSFRIASFALSKP